MMEDTNLNPGETPVSTETQETDDLNAKDYVLDRIAQEIAAFTGKKSGAKTLAKRVLLVTTESIFNSVVQEGYFRFSGGFGALKIKQIAATQRRVPATGQMVNCPARKKVAYVEGKTTKALANNS